MFCDSKCTLPSLSDRCRIDQTIQCIYYIQRGRGWGGYRSNFAPVVMSTWKCEQFQNSCVELFVMLDFQRMCVSNFTIWCWQDWCVYRLFEFIFGHNFSLDLTSIICIWEHREGKSYIYIYACIHIFINIYKFIYTYVYICIPCICIQKYLHTHICVYMCTYVYRYTDMQTHIRTNTHIQSFIRLHTYI